MLAKKKGLQCHTLRSGGMTHAPPKVLAGCCVENDCLRNNTAAAAAALAAAAGGGKMVAGATSVDVSKHTLIYF